MLRFLAAALLIPVVAACTDREAGAGVVEPSGAVLLSTDGDPDTSWPVKINWTSAVASFSSPAVYHPAPAIVDAAMSYDAHHASIGAALHLRGATSDDRTFTPAENHTVNFNDNVFSRTFSILTPKNCGHTLESEVVFTAWFIGKNLVTLEKYHDTKTPVAFQSRCTAEDTRTVRTGGSGGGGGSGCPTCVDVPASGYTWCKVRVKYYLDTGEVISQTTLYCW